MPQDLDFHNFSAQEPESFGRSLRESFPTPGLVAHNAQLARNRASQALRAATMEARSTQSTQSLSFRGHAPPSSNCTNMIAAASKPVQPTLSDDLSNQNPNNGYEFSPEELAEIGDDPYANYDPPLDPMDYRMPMSNRPTNNEDFFQNTIGPGSQSITSTPVDLPPLRTLVQRGRGDKTPTTPKPFRANVTTDTLSPAACPLVRRTHVIAPIVDNLLNNDVDKENMVLSIGANDTQVLGKRAGDPELPMENNYDSDDNSSASCQQDKKGGLRASDLNPARRRILEIAILHYRMHLATTTPYPHEPMSAKGAVDAWQRALDGLIATGGYRGLTLPTVAEIGLVL